MTRREVNWFLVAGGVAVLIAILVTRLLLPDPNPPATAAAASTPAAAQPGLTADVLAELAAGWRCRQAAQAAMQPSEDLRGSWARHAEAHHLGITGKISEDEMRRRWKVTLGQREIQDPVFEQAHRAMMAACGGQP